MPESLVFESSLAGGTRVFTTAPELAAPIANVHIIFALEKDTPTIPGELEVLLEWMQRGTQTRTRRALGEAFGALGVEPQLTSFDAAVAFSFQALDVIREPICALAAEQLFSPALLEDELAEILREFDEDERASYDEPSDIAGRAHRLARWSGTPLWLPPNGSVSSRKELSADYLRSLHASIFRRPAIIAVASSQSAPWVDAVDKHLVSARDAALFPYRAASRAALSPAPRQVVVDAPTMDHAVIMRFAPGPAANDLHAIARARLLHEALCEGMSAPLMNELRGQQALSYTVSSSLIDRGDLWDQLFEIEPEPKHVQRALDSAQKLWSDASLLTQEDFDRARAQIATSERIHTIDAGRALSTTLREEILRGRPIGWRAQLDALRANITTEEAIDSARHWGLSQPALATVIVGPAKKLPKAYRADAMTLAEVFDPKN